VSGTKCYGCDRSINIPPVNIKRVRIDGRKRPLCARCAFDHTLQKNLQQFSDNYEEKE